MVLSEPAWGTYKYILKWQYKLEKKKAAKIYRSTEQNKTTSEIFCHYQTWLSAQVVFMPINKSIISTQTVTVKKDKSFVGDNNR